MPPPTRRSSELAQLGGLTASFVLDGPMDGDVARQLADDLGSGASDRIRAILMALGCRVRVEAERINIRLSRRALSQLLSDPSASISLNAAEVTSDDTVVLTAPARLARVGRGVRLLFDGTDRAPSPNPSLLRMLARAHKVKTRLIENPELSAHDIAREEQLSAAHLYMVLRLAWLAPDIVSSILDGRQPPQLSAKTLMRRAARLPPEWGQQRTLLGFR
jgi:hypothetical protein